MPLAVANRYASALADVVTKSGSPVGAEAALEQLRAFGDLMQQSSELRNVLTSPAVSPADKRALVATLAKRVDISDPVRNFLYVVIDHRRMSLLAEMIEAFRAWLDERAGVARMKVTSAQPIHEPQRSALIEKFTHVTGKNVIADFQVSPDLIGGATVRYASTVFDGSLRAQLESLDRVLSGEG